MALALVVGVFFAHDSANLLSRATGLYPWAVFFMTMASGTVILAACLFILIAAAEPSFWRNVALVALGIWMVEGSMIPVCGLASGFLSIPPPGVNLCDHITGWPVTKITVTLEVLILGVLIWTELRSYPRR